MRYMKLNVLQEIGGYAEGNLNVNYKQVVEKLFEPNVIELDDPDKVIASWGFKDDNGRKSFIWSYKFYGNIEDCNTFSVSGDKDLLRELFSDNVEFY